MEHTDMRIQAVAFRGFAPFADGEIDFPSSAEGAAHDNPVESPKLGMVHLLTGQNGTGKTRLLSLMAAACGNPKNLLERLHRPESASAYIRFLFGANYGIWGPYRNVGFINAGVGFVSSQSTMEELWEGIVDGDFLDIHDGGLLKWVSNADQFVGNLVLETELALSFRGTVRATDAPIQAMQPLDFGSTLDHLDFDRSDREDSLICQSMANLKISAALEALRSEGRTDGRAACISDRLEKTISLITARSFKFDVIESPKPHLKVFWGNVTMRIAELPDGLRSIIGWLVSCIAKLDAKFPEHPSPLDVPLLLLLDEPESHLHPAWQRKLIPAAQILFPNSQMFIATHSPFVISSVNHGWIHILRANAEGLVVADQPIPCSPGDTYLDVVSDILGIQEWYDPETENLLTEFRSIRKEVIDGKSSVDHLRSKAEIIAARSESLSTMMARELRQLDRLLVSEVAEP